jgi:hypothetical protein
MPGNGPFGRDGQEFLRRYDALGTAKLALDQRAPSRPRHPLPAIRVRPADLVEVAAKATQGLRLGCVRGPQRRKSASSCTLGLDGQHPPPRWRTRSAACLAPIGAVAESNRPFTPPRVAPAWSGVAVVGRTGGTLGVIRSHDSEPWPPAARYMKQPGRRRSRGVTWVRPSPDEHVGSAM